MTKSRRAEAIREVRAQLPSIVARWMREDPEYAAHVKRAGEIQAPILGDLARAGFDVGSLDELRHLDRPWKDAIPVLQQWLPRVEDPDIKESIVRCLSVPWVCGAGTQQLIEELRRSDPKALHLWAVGNALSIVSIEGFERQLLQLCRLKQYGTARQMIVYSVWRLGTGEAEEVALELLEDEDVKLHAIHALKRMKSKRALFALERLLNDKKASVRKQARNAITSISRSI